jgi:hydrogenase maturation protein HypF
MLKRGLNTVPCSSIGRLFDGVAALLELATGRQFEGQAAMALENCSLGSTVQWHLPFAIYDNGAQSAAWTIDWQPMVLKLIELKDQATPTADLAAAFHNTLAQIIVEISERTDGCPVFLSGGVFQNKRLTETAMALLRPGRDVFCHRQVPPNDGGLCLGQIHFARLMEGVS